MDKTVRRSEGEDKEMNFEHQEDQILVSDADGRVIAMANFPEVKPGVVNIIHTQVDESLRGRGIAGRLMEALVDQLREEGRKAILSCSYAIKWMSSHPDAQDVLENPEEEARRAGMVRGEACGIMPPGSRK